MKNCQKSAKCKNNHLVRCRISHGVIRILNVICLKYMTCVLILIANVRNKSLSSLINTKSKELDFEINYTKTFNGTEEVWDSFLEPALSIATPYIKMGVAAKTKNP